MRLRRPPSAAALVVLTVIGYARASAADAAPRAPGRVVIGLIPEMNIFRQKARFAPLGQYLSKRAGVPVQYTILSRYGNLVDSFRSEGMDGAFFGSFTGALAIQRLGVVPLARPVNIDGASTYHGRLFVRRDSGIRGPRDMRGKRMAFVDRATTAGYVFPLAYLHEHGVRAVDRFFGELYFTGSHDAAIRAVLDRKADVGAAKHSIYDRVQREDPRVERELLVLAESPEVPSNALCVSPSLDPALRERLKAALLGLERDPEGAAVLQQLGAVRFIETTARDYEPVARLAARAGIDVKTYQYRNE